MLAKERLRHVKARHANPFDSNSDALLEEIEYTDGDACTAARVGEIYCFSDDVIRDQEASTVT